MFYLFFFNKVFNVQCVHGRSQYDARGGIIVSTTCNCVLVSSVKYSLNTAPKCSILRSNNKKKFWRGFQPSPQNLSGHPRPAPHLSRRFGHLDERAFGVWPVHFASSEIEVWLRPWVCVCVFFNYATVSYFLYSAAGLFDVIKIDWLIDWLTDSPSSVCALCLLRTVIGDGDTGAPAARHGHRRSLWCLCQSASAAGKETDVHHQSTVQLSQPVVPGDLHVWGELLRCGISAD